MHLLSGKLIKQLYNIVAEVVVIFSTLTDLVHCVWYEGRMEGCTDLASWHAHRI